MGALSGGNSQISYTSLTNLALVSLQMLKILRRARAGGPPLKISNREVNAVEDDEEGCNLEDWIFPTVSGGLRNWEARDFVPITFIPQ